MESLNTCSLCIVPKITRGAARPREGRWACMTVKYSRICTREACGGLTAEHCLCEGGDSSVDATVVRAATSRAVWDPISKEQRPSLEPAMSIHVFVSLQWEQSQFVHPYVNKFAVGRGDPHQ